MKRALASRTLSIAAIAAMGLSLAACGGSESGSGEEMSKGPIKIWYSNNEAEVAWGKQMVKAWNKEHPDQKVKAQQIPAGKSSEEVIAASITAGTAPCLIYNTAPVAVPQFQRMGGLVALDSFEGGADYIEKRSGELASQYQSQDGSYYQIPWKSNPVVLFYNKDIFKKAGLDPEDPPLDTQKEFLETSRTLVESGAVENAVWPSPASDFFQSWFDFYPFYAAASDGQQLLEDGKATFNSEAGKSVAKMWQTIYKEGLSSKEVYTGDTFADRKAAMAISGPWAIAAYGDKINWGTVPIPGTEQGGQSHTFADAKNVALYSACENKGTAWEVLKFSTSKEQDRKLLEMTGQMPMRADLTNVYSDYFEENPAYKEFAEQAKNAVGVPQAPNSVEIWQNFRNAWVGSVIHRNTSIDKAFEKSATEINELASQQ
ncbi:type 2 periplasmic-binding domain-containing protein [Arthrobacter pigmenti]